MSYPESNDPSTGVTIYPEKTSEKLIVFKDWLGHMIDYSKPDLYLKSGNQSELSQQNTVLIKAQLPGISHDLSGIAAINNWKSGSFNNYAASGVNVGKMTVNRLMELKQLSGCHDHGLLLVSVLRMFGFPSVMIDAVGIQWAVEYQKSGSGGFSGHIFIETYVDNKWILVNSTSGEYVAEYNPEDPVIPMKSTVEKTGYYAILKGLDPEDYGITGIEKLNGYMKSFAERINTISITMPEYKIQRLILR